jgi:hypothetical protein
MLTTHSFYWQDQEQWIYTSAPPYVFVECRLIEHKDNFTFYVVS